MALVHIETLSRSALAFNGKSSLSTLKNYPNLSGIWIGSAQAENKGEIIRGLVE